MLIKLLRDYSTKENDCYAVLFVALTFSIVIHLSTVKAVVLKTSWVMGLLSATSVHFGLIEKVGMLWNF
ncbi:MAG: hypothetical protein GY928_06475 [Colwellia sp.]|nr:hypothetical protein [Colwellia sp.]